MKNGLNSAACKASDALSTTTQRTRSRCDNGVCCHWEPPRGPRLPLATYGLSTRTSCGPHGPAASLPEPSVSHRRKPIATFTVPSTLSTRKLSADRKLSYKADFARQGRPRAMSSSSRRRRVHDSGTTEDRKSSADRLRDSAGRLPRSKLQW